MKVLIVGLPYFAKKLEIALSDFDSDNQYIALNTSFSFYDKIRYLFLLPGADIVYSLNGSVYSHKPIKLALWLKKKVIMHWMGTDVLISASQLDKKPMDYQLRDRSIHYCVADWLGEELSTIGVKAETLGIIPFESELNKNPSWPEKFRVLSYVARERPEFYGMKEIIKSAEAFPDVEFWIVGISDYSQAVPENIKLLGWINSMEEIMAECAVVLRFMEHDGLSSFVLESLAMGRYVLYNYNLPPCNFVENYPQIQQELSRLKEKFDSGNLLSNTKGIEFIEQGFNKEVILSSIIDKLKG